MHVLIVDDHAVVREGLKQILRVDLPEAEFGEAATGSEAVELIWQRPWDVVVLDINLPGRSGVEVLKDIRQSKPHLPVLVMSVHSEDQYALRVLRAGAAGYITKDSADELLVAAVRRVLAGGRYVSPALAERLAAHLTEDLHRPIHELLSDREFEVFRHLAAGKTVKEIGAVMSLSVKTISTYRTRILDKTQFKTNADIMRYAVHHGLM